MYVHVCVNVCVRECVRTCVFLLIDRFNSFKINAAETICFPLVVLFKPLPTLIHPLPSTKVMTTDHEEHHSHHQSKTGISTRPKSRTQRAGQGTHYSGTILSQRLPCHRGHSRKMAPQSRPHLHAVKASLCQTLLCGQRQGKRPHSLARGSVKRRN